MVTLFAPGNAVASAPKAPSTVRKFAALLCEPSTLTLVAFKTGAARVVKLQVAIVLELDSPLNATVFSAPLMAVVGMRASYASRKFSSTPTKNIQV